MIPDLDVVMILLHVYTKTDLGLDFMGKKLKGIHRDIFHRFFFLRAVFSLHVFKVNDEG